MLRVVVVPLHVFCGAVRLSALCCACTMCLLWCCLSLQLSLPQGSAAVTGLSHFSSCMAGFHHVAGCLRCSCTIPGLHALSVTRLCSCSFRSKFQVWQCSCLVLVRPFCWQGMVFYAHAAQAVHCVHAVLFTSCIAACMRTQCWLFVCCCEGLMHEGHLSVCQHV